MKSGYSLLAILKDEMLFCNSESSLILLFNIDIVFLVSIVRPLTQSFNDKFIS